VQTSRGKHNRLHRTPAGFTALALDGYGLHGHWPTRLTRPASYPVSVRQVTALLHASFRPRLATTPLRFANPSPPSGWVEDLHLQAVMHARHTKKRGERSRVPSSHMIGHRIMIAATVSPLRGLPDRSRAARCCQAKEAPHDTLLPPAVVSRVNAPVPDSVTLLSSTRKAFMPLPPVNII